MGKNHDFSIQSGLKSKKWANIIDWSKITAEIKHPFTSKKIGTA